MRSVIVGSNIQFREAAVDVVITEMQGGCLQLHRHFQAANADGELAFRLRMYVESQWEGFVQQ